MYFNKYYPQLCPYCLGGRDCNNHSGFCTCLQTIVSKDISKEGRIYWDFSKAFDRVSCVL